MSDDASATYRGFRNQALYALHRLLTDREAASRIYRPEGVEDLAIFDMSMRLIEVVQVKDHSSPLGVSDLNPKSGTGFFERLRQRRRDYPSCLTRLASFGPLGPELSGALRGPGRERSSVVEKVCAGNGELNAPRVHQLLDELSGNVVHTAEAELRLDVLKVIEGTIVGGDSASAVELLLFWVFEASEKRLDITRNGTIQKLERIGAFLASLRDSSSEWGVSVSPVKDLTLSDEEIERWTLDFRKGVQARWEHVVARADCSRPAKLNQIHTLVRQSPVVILRGASGQGKSTLGWRYLHDYWPEGLRFHVGMVEGKEQAIRIANALGSHVRKLSLAAVVYLDVAPTDSGWSALVRELVAAGLRVIVAVREEDFRRANIAVGDFDYAELVLDRISREEAEPIFMALHQASSALPLDFEEAWSRFAADDGGPLLEFTHLVSQGETLASRIAGQVRRLQDDAYANLNGLSTAHLEMLALAALANETGARVSFLRLCDAVGVSPLTGPLKALEDEYLLKAADADGEACVSGLHVLRSRAIVQALMENGKSLTQSLAVKAIDLVVDHDTEMFLLATFSRRPELSAAIVERLQRLEPRSWTQTAGIMRALLWEGTSGYERSNDDALSDAIEKYEGAWWMACDWLIAMDSALHQNLLKTTADVLKIEVQPIPLTPKEGVFELAANWVSRVPPPPRPGAAKDWASAGEACHWLGHMRATGPVLDDARQLLPSPLPSLGLEDLALFISGRSQLGDEEFSSWHGAEKPAIIERFLKETDSLHVRDDEQVVKVFFSVPIASSITSKTSDGHDWNAQSMKRVRLLRLLFPRRTSYCAQGLGLEPLAALLPNDPTLKEIPGSSLPPERSAQLNGRFVNLVAYRRRRPTTWREYGAAALAFRRATSDCFRKLHRGWAKLLAETTPRSSTVKSLPGVEIGRLMKLSKLPMFPRNAVDEWGFTSEDRVIEPGAPETMQGRSLRRFDAWRRAFHDYESPIGNIVNRLVILTAAYVDEQLGGVPDADADRRGRLFLANLAGAWEALPLMQQEFRTRFSSLVPQTELQELEEHERSDFRHLWPIAFAMHHERGPGVRDFARVQEAAMVARRSEFLRSLREELATVMPSGGVATVHETPWIVDGVPHLRVVLDLPLRHAIEWSPVDAVKAISKATRVYPWRPFEWKPLEITWRKVALITLVSGRAVTPAAIILDLSTLFLSTGAFEVKPHHTIALPVPMEVFESSGSPVWQGPLGRAAARLNGHVQAFVATNRRFYPIAKLVNDEGLSQARANRIMAAFSTELSIVLTEAQESFSQMVGILRSSAVVDAQVIVGRLTLICKRLLYEVESEGTIAVTIDTFAAWADGLAESLQEFETLSAQIVALSLELEGGRS